MNLLVTLSQITIALSIIIVWVFRFDNIVNEFKTYQLPDLVRNLVGAAKISLATLLIVSIWYPQLIAGPAIAMGFLMLCAQIVHVKVNSPAMKRIPSAALLVLCCFLAILKTGTSL